VKFSEITDGLSNTLAIGEKHVPLGSGCMGCAGSKEDGAVFHSGPAGVFRRASVNNLLASAPTDDYHNQFGSHHTGIVQFAFADGSVRGLKTSVPGTTLGLLANRADGQPIPDYE
jgi:hypothetical protein